MNVIYKKLIIENFKGFKKKEVDFDEKTTLIKGANEVGKSTVFDAVDYCLYGKNSTGETQFGILPNNAPMGVSPMVTLEIAVDDKPVTLSRCYKAKKNRQKEFTGEYNTVCEINGIDKGVKGFEQYIGEIVDNDVFKLLTSTSYFMEHMIAGKGETISQKQRKILYSICELKGDIDLVNEKIEKYEGLVEPLKRYDNASEYMKSLKNQLSKLNKEIDDFSTRVDQQVKNFIEVDFDVLELEDEIACNEAELERLQKEKDEILCNDCKQKLKDSLQETKNKLSALESENQKHKETSKLEHEKSLLEKTADLREKMNNLINEYRKEKNETERKNDSLCAKRNSLQADINLKKTIIKKLAAEYKNVDGQEIVVEEKCNSCNRPYDEKSVAFAKEAKEKEKKEKLEEISKKGKEHKTQLASLNADIEAVQKDIYALPVISMTDSIEALKQQIQAIQDGEEKFVEKDKPDYEERKNELSAEITLQEINIKENEDVFAEDKKNIEELISESKLKMQELKENQVISEKNDECQEKIDSLEKEHKEKLAKKDELQMNLDICSEFIQEKCKLATETVNKMFETTKWKLFDFTKEGELKEVCVPTFNGTEYNDLSTSTRIICGLDIISAFQKHYDRYLPIVFENSEGIDFVPQSESQTIVLRVVPEPCPKCGGTTGRRRPDGLWKCKNEKCGYTWKKEMVVE